MAPKSLRFCPNVHVGMVFVWVPSPCPSPKPSLGPPRCFVNVFFSVIMNGKSPFVSKKNKEDGNLRKNIHREHANFICLPYEKVRTQTGALAATCKSAAGYGVKHWRAFKKVCDLRAVELVLSGRLIRGVSPNKKKPCRKKYFIRMSWGDDSRLW